MADIQSGVLVPGQLILLWAYQHVDGAAHTVLGTLIMCYGAVGQQVLQQTAEQQSQLLS